MAKTKNYELEKPEESHNISEEFPILRQNLDKIDEALKSNADTAAGKADKDHNHEIADVSGLQAALDKKADSGGTLKFADLADVVDFDLAALGYVAVKTDKGIEMRSPQAAIGDHKHKIDDINGLNAKLQKIADDADLRNKDNNWSGTNTFKNDVSVNSTFTAKNGMNLVGDLVLSSLSNPQWPFLKIIIKEGKKRGGGVSIEPQGGSPRLEIGYHQDGGLHLWRDGQGDFVIFHPNGDIELPKGVKFGAGGDIYAPEVWQKRWNVGDGWAHAGISGLFSRTVTGVRTGGQWHISRRKWGDLRSDRAGAVMIGIGGGDWGISDADFKVIQMCINGNWFDVWGF